MAEIVNLRRVKKQRARAEASEQAAQNRVRHGRSAAQKQSDAAEAAKRRALLDGVRLVDRDVPATD
jgi:Domain of unknown function (DUF4169)